MILVAAIALLAAALRSLRRGAIVCSNCEQEAMAVLRQIDQLQAMELAAESHGGPADPAEGHA